MKIGKRKKGGCVFTARCQKKGICYWKKCRFYRENLAGLEITT
ncbi:MAG: hypothetical protein WCS52_02175 [bacterium]